MKSSSSIVGSVTRSFVWTSVVSGLVTSLVAGAIAMRVLLAHDDGSALALARTLGSELSSHHGESDLALDRLIRHEQMEQRWFHRPVEVWTGPEQRLGGSAIDGRYGAYQGADGCHSAVVNESWTRVCVAHVIQPQAAIIVASPLSAIVWASLPIVEVVCLTVLMSVALLAMVGRWAIVRALSPLARFHESLVLHDGNMNARWSTRSWGATEIDRLARAFDELLERVAALFEREQRFAANAAHELRTPLTRLRGQIELAMAELEDQNVNNPRLALAAQSCQELTRSIEALLALSEDKTSQFERVDLGEVATHTGHEYGDEIEVVEDSPAMVQGDLQLITLAVRNLVDNACKYAAGPVRLSVCVLPGECAVVVEDEGPGIPDELLEHMLEPFARGNHAKAGIRGSGLGLSLVDHVARLHGGRLTLTPRPLRGLRACLSLPQTASVEAVVAAEAARH